MIRRLAFDLVYPLSLRMEGNPVWPVRRRVRAVEAQRRGAFDGLLDAALKAGGLFGYNLPYHEVGYYL